jgi:peptidyl-prolyl cis-trans isomerase SurA
MFKMRIAVVVSTLVITAMPLAAQQPASPAGTEQLVDRVVAVVGDTVLLLSDVQSELQQIEAAGQEVPTDPAAREAFADQIMDARINDLVLLEAARRAGIEVPEDQVDQMVDDDIDAVRQRFNGDEILFQQALASSGITLDAYRAQLAGQYRDRQMIEALVGQRLRSRARPLVSEDQIREVFEAQSGALGIRPANISLRQVIIAPAASDSAREAAQREAAEVLQLLAEGEDFEVLARRFSDDTGTAEHGGDLGWFKAGRMVPEFERVAFALRPGETSGIVPTDFGYHIIRLERVRGPERQARHILIRPEVSDADRTLARQRADSVVTAVREGASIVALAPRYDTPAGEVEIARIPIERLPPAYVGALTSAQAGEVVGPIEITGPAGSSWAVVEVSARQAEGAYTLDDVREQLRTRLQEQEMIEELVAELRNEVYVSVIA